MPYSVLVEVVAALRRRTGSVQLAMTVQRHLEGFSGIRFVALEGTRAGGVAAIAGQTGLRGMDALVVQVAQEFGANLVTLDDEMIIRARGVVEVRRPSQVT